MEEQELMNRFHSLFEDTQPILQNMYKGFVGQKPALLKEAKSKFREIWKSRLPAVEKILEHKDKNEVEKKFITLLPHLQRVGLAIDSLVDKMEIKVETNVLFSQKALDELKQLMIGVGAEFTDVKDYCMTKNPALKEQIRLDMEKIRKMIDDFEIIHQDRLITGVCVPQASYLYVDMMDSLKRMAKELATFADKA
jgi:Na+/phosphate symporter